MLNKKPGTAEMLPPKIGDFPYSESALTAQLKFLLGEILTIIDASVPDVTQNKAIKDLITSRVWSRRDWIMLSVQGRGSAESVE